MMSGCNHQEAADTGPQAIVARTADDHSYARPQEARVRHVDLDLTADFQARQLKGTASL
ncbi:MAG: hypothetical protein JF571_09235, partial [Asticcacaulis sp.]|nr:hypothetical protein [Asticcacaulis sp.]